MAGTTVKATDSYKTSILDQLSACSVLGDKGALLRREGLYYSTITRWRRQMARKSKTHARQFPSPCSCDSQRMSPTPLRAEAESLLSP